VPVGDGPDPQTLQALSRRRALRLAGVGGASVLAVAAGVTVLAAQDPGPARHATPTRAPVPAPVPWLYLTILTGHMIGKPGWPEYVPAFFTVPAHTLLQVEIRCFDSGTATVPSGYERVRGTVGGTMEVLSAVNGDVDTAPAKRVAELASTGVAHTLTFSDLGVNVPIPPLATVRFALRTPAPGRYGWQCMAACGTGQGGWGGPMAESGYMQGVMTVV
jgi:hypothetical protein